MVWEDLGAGLSISELALGTSGEGGQLLALRFDQARYQLRLLSPPGGVRVPEDAPKDSVAIWNGGYF